MPSYVNDKGGLLRITTDPGRRRADCLRLLSNALFAVRET